MMLNTTQTCILGVFCMYSVRNTGIHGEYQYSMNTDVFLCILVYSCVFLCIPVDPCDRPVGYTSTKYTSAEYEEEYSRIQQNTYENTHNNAILPNTHEYTQQYTTIHYHNTSEYTVFLQYTRIHCILKCILVYSDAFQRVSLPYARPFPFPFLGDDLP
jgi:hypothetical protein